MSNSNSNNNDLDYEDYLEERKLLLQAKREGANLFDKSILTLSAGAFGLSLTFYNQIVPIIKPGTEFLLIIAWIGFGMSMVITLLSIFTSRSACLRQIQILESQHSLSEEKEDERNNEKNYPAIWTKILNILSMVIFPIGVGFLAIFSIINLLNKNGGCNVG